MFLTGFLNDFIVNQFLFLLCVTYKIFPLSVTVKSLRKINRILILHKNIQVKWSDLYFDICLRCRIFCRERDTTLSLMHAK